MLVLGYIYWLVQIGKKPEEEAEELETKPGLIKGPGTEIIVLLILLIVAYIFTSQTNLKPWGVFKGVIVGYGDIMEGKYVEGVDAYRQALIGTPLDHDGRVTLINLATSNPEMFAQMQASTAKANLDYIISLAQADLRLNPADSLMQMQLAQILNTAARVNYQDTKLFNYYSSQALEAIDRSIAASPGRIPVYLVKAEMQMMRGEKDESVATVNYAISLNPGYYEGYCHLARFYIYLKDNKSLLQPLNECLDKGGIASLNSDLLLKSAISFEASQNDYPRALSLAQKLATVSGASGEVWFNLAKLYMVTGDAAQADIAAQKAVSLDPQFKAAWASFLQSVGKGVATSTASTTGQKK